MEKPNENLDQQLRALLEEARVVIPGVQTLLGFQLICGFQSALSQKPFEDCAILSSWVDGANRAGNDSDCESSVVPSIVRARGFSRFSAQVFAFFNDRNVRTRDRNLHRFSVSCKCHRFQRFACIDFGVDPVSKFFMSVVYFSSNQRTRPAMKTCISKLKPFHKKNVLNVVVETPQGSRGKYRYDEESGLFELSKIMPAGMEFPYDFGFVPGTKAQDGDPLDVLVFLNVHVPVGCLLRCRPIGVIEATQTEKNGKSTRNDRIVAVPDEKQGNSHSDVKSLKDMNKELLKEFELFFINFNSIRDVKFKLLGCRGPKTAFSLVRKATLKK